MGWFIVILILIITVSVLYGIIRILSKIFKKSRLLFFIVVACIILIPYELLKNYEETFYIEHIPQEMGVSKILYQKTESWGFGPGGNETGVVVFELPDNSAKTIQNAGKNYFYVISKEDTPRNKYIRKCGEWSETPVKSEPNTNWHLGNFLDQYGFGIYVEQSIEDEVDEAMQTSGSYYTGCAGGALIIVAPKIKKVFFVYAG